MKNRFTAIKTMCAILCISLTASCAVEKSETPIHIPFTFENDRIIVNATINGQEGRFIFHSGITHIATEIKPHSLFPIGFTKRVINGRNKFVLVYKTNSIQFGDTTVKVRAPLVNEGDWLHELREEEAVDGVLGTNAFEGYWMELSFARNEIVLHSTKPEHFSNHVPLKAMSKNEPLYAPVNVDGKDVYMSISTGMPEAFLFPNGLIKNKGGIIKEVETNGALKVHIVETSTVSTLDDVFRDKFILTFSSLVATRNFASRNNLGIMGIYFMRYYDFLFDYRDIRRGKTSGMYYKPITDIGETKDLGLFSFLDELPSVGIINFAITTEGLEVDSVMKDSEAYTVYNVRPGSVITKINGQDIASIPREWLNFLLSFEDIESFSMLNEAREEVTYRIKTE